METFIKQFNEIFKDDAVISKKDKGIEITIGTKTIEIEYPDIVMVKSMAQLPKS